MDLLSFPMDCIEDIFRWVISGYITVQNIQIIYDLNLLHFT